MDSLTRSVRAAKLQVDKLETVQDLEGTAVETQQSIWKLILENRRLFLYALLANSGALLFGYDIIVQGTITALPAFSYTSQRITLSSILFGSQFGDALILPALWQGLWQAMNSLGIMVGATMNGALQDRFGRKKMFFVGGVIAAIGGALEFVSADFGGLETRRGVLLAAKVILGLAMGTLMSSCQTYVSEISSPRLRTMLLGLFPLLTAVGQLTAISVVFGQISDFTKMAVKIPFASQWAFAGFAMVSSIILPESPTWLVNNEKIEPAEKSLKRLHGLGSDASQLIHAIQLTIQQESTMAHDIGTVHYSECFKGSDLRRTGIVTLLNSLQQLMGVALLANSTYFFIMAGMSPNRSLFINQISLGFTIPATMISWAILARFGRRPTILYGFIAAFLFFLSMGIAAFFPGSSAALNYIGVSLNLVGIANSLSVATAWPILTAEIPSVRLRAKTLGLGFFVNAFMSWVFNFCVPYMFNSDQGNLGGKIGFVFCGTSIIGFVSTWFVVPETKNITYFQLNYLFQTGAKTREFRKGMAVEEHAPVERTPSARGQ